MLKLLKNIFKPKVKTLNTIYINKKNILDNVDLIKNFQPKASFFPVLKSNAYWHWIKQIVEILKWKDFPYLAVDSFPEYQIILKNSNFNILLLTETIKENYKYFNFKRTTFVVYNLETLKYLISLNKKIKIHLFLNTWMNREWLQKENLEDFLLNIKNSKIELEWVMSHFHSADEWWFKKSIYQIIEFKEMYSIIEEKWFSPKYRHIWASAWILRLEDDFFNAFRPWIILYGYNPLNFRIHWKTNLLKPALRIISTVTSLQKVKKFSWVWYSHKNIIQKNSIVWTIPFWYYEWFFRKFSNHLKFKDCNNKYYIYSQVWLISMNMTNFFADKDTKIWDKIEIISENFFDKNSINNICEINHCSIYEILSKINKDIRREII